MKKIVKLFLKEKTFIEVLFDDGVVKKYDCLAMAKKYPQLNKLKNRKIFLKGKVLGCSGIKWNEEIDIDGETIYQDGKTMTLEEQIESYLLGFKLKEERIKKSLSQVELAKLTGIDQADISKIENGTGNPTLNTIQKYCKSLNKSIVYKIN